MPPAPRLAASVREAATDLYYNSLRFIGANLIFGAGLAVTLYASSRSPLGLLLFVVLIPPTAGLMAMAVRLARHGHVAFADFIDGIRQSFWRNLGLGTLQLFLGLVLIVDLVVGLRWESPFGIVLAVFAMYGLLALWLLAVAAWPLLLDPERHADRTRRTLRVAAVLVLAHPLRMLGLGVLIAAVLVVSTVAFAAIVMFALAFAWLIVARYVLPAADRLEGRATVVVDQD